MKNAILNLNEKFWLSFLIYIFLPILPLILNGIIGLIMGIGKYPDPGSVYMSAAMYLIGKGISSESFLVFIAYFFLSIILFVIYTLYKIPGAAKITDGFMIGVGIVIIVFVMILSLLENYKFYVMECRPLEVKFAKDLINLTSNSGKSTNN